MHLREYLHPRARSCSGRRVSSPPPTATFPRLPTPHDATSKAAVGYGGLQQVSAHLMGSPRDDHRGIQGYP